MYGIEPKCWFLREELREKDIVTESSFDSIVN